MSEKRTIRRSAADRRKGKTDWKRVKALSEDEIEQTARADEDAQPTTAAFWKDAALYVPGSKQSITLRLDRDMLQWYKMQGPWLSNPYECRPACLYGGPQAD